MISVAMIKAAAVGGIALLWGDFTHKAIKICRQIIFPPKIIHLERCEYCRIYFPCNDNSCRWVLTQPIYVCNRGAEKEVV